MSLASKISRSGRQPKVGCPVPPQPRLLLSPNIPTPMHETAPRTVLGAAWWDAERKRAYEYTNYHCLACGVHKSQARFHRWLEGHELYAVNYSQGKMRYLSTVALCHCCHAFIHDGRLQSLLDEGKITHARYATIIQHGTRILSNAGLSRKPLDRRTPKKVARWDRWRLVIDGVEYPGRYSTEQEWKDAHSH